LVVLKDSPPQYTFFLAAGVPFHSPMTYRLYVVLLTI
jgi:hypothetical protein